MIGDFVDAVRTRRPCDPDFAEGRVQQLCDAGSKAPLPAVSDCPCDARITLVATVILAAVARGVDDPLTAVDRAVVGVAAEGCSLEPPSAPVSPLSTATRCWSSRRPTRSPDPMR